MLGDQNANRGFLNLHKEKNEQQCVDRLLLNTNSFIFTYFLNRIICYCYLGSGAYNAYLAAFDLYHKSKTSEQLNFANNMLEIFFLLDFILNFFKYEKPPNGHYALHHHHDFSTVSMEYIKGQFVWDFVPLLPF